MQWSVRRRDEAPLPLPRATRSGPRPVLRARTPSPARARASSPDTAHRTVETTKVVSVSERLTSHTAASASNNSHSPSRNRRLRTEASAGASCSALHSRSSARTSASLQSVMLPRIEELPSAPSHRVGAPVSAGGVERAYSPIQVIRLTAASGAVVNGPRRPTRCGRSGRRVRPGWKRRSACRALSRRRGWCGGCGRGARRSASRCRRPGAVRAFVSYAA